VCVCVYFEASGIEPMSLTWTKMWHNYVSQGNLHENMEAYNLMLVVENY